MTSSAIEAVERALARLGDDKWNAFLHVDAQRARERARNAEGPLAGLVLSVKDNLALAGMPMTCGSLHLKDYVAPYDATVVERLERAGAVILGKTNMDEFAAGSSGENSAFGPTLNPADITRVPGGSSSGAGASVASGVCDAALGSDTGGSIRCPASFCGVAALKPSYGLVSRYGLSDLAMSLESPAPAARDVTTLARIMGAIAGPDARDARTAGSGEIGTLHSQMAGTLRIGVPEEAFTGVADDVSRPVRSALAKLERHGATLLPIHLPTIHDALAAYYVINYAEFASAMQRFDGTRYGTTAATPEDARATFGDEVKRRILLGTFVTSREERGRWYDAALRVQAAVAADLARAFGACDILAMPTMPVRAFKLGERIGDPRAMYAADVLTVPANLAGVPAGSVPLNVSGLPVGLQLLGPHGADARVLSVMKLVEDLA
ncbi:MAG: amidase family protein [Candidatus Thermoplasmatota archaeon]